MRKPRFELPPTLRPRSSRRARLRQLLLQLLAKGLVRVAGSEGAHALIKQESEGSSRIQRALTPAQRFTPLPKAKKNSAGLVPSVLLHSAILVLLLFSSKEAAVPDARKANAVTPARKQEVSMVYLPPPPSTRTPRPDPATTAPEPSASSQPEVPGAAPTPPAPTQPVDPVPTAADPTTSEARRDATPAPAPLAPTPANEVLKSLAAVSPTAESEAQRLFGPHPVLGPSEQTTPGVTGGNHPWRPVWAERANCMPEPAADDTAHSMGSVTGTVFAEGSHVPVPGAYLQIVGTPYSAFSDPRGSYHLIFPAVLVANCRTQQVRVIAAGYLFRDMLLAIGAGSTDIPLSRH